MHEATANDPLVPEHPEEPRVVVEHVGEFAVCQEARVGVGGVAQPLHEGGEQHRLDAILPGCPRGQRFEVLVRAIRELISQHG